MSSTRQVALKINGVRVGRSISDRLRVEPPDDLVLDRESEEMVTTWIVVSDEILLHIVPERAFVSLIIPEVDLVHIEEIELSGDQVIDDLLVISLPALPHFCHRPIGVE